MLSNAIRGSTFAAGLALMASLTSVFASPLVPVDSGLEIRDIGGVCGQNSADQGACKDPRFPHCACLYLIAGTFPTPGIWIYACQKSAQGAC